MKRLKWLLPLAQGAVALFLLLHFVSVPVWSFICKGSVLCGTGCAVCFCRAPADVECFCLLIEIGTEPDVEYGCDCSCDNGAHDRDSCTFGGDGGEPGVNPPIHMN